MNGFEIKYLSIFVFYRVPPTVENCAAEKLNVPIAEQQPIFPQYLNTNDSTRGAGSTWRLNMALNNINNIMVKNLVFFQLLGNQVVSRADTTITRLSAFAIHGQFVRLQFLNNEID